MGLAGQTLGKVEQCQHHKDGKEGITRPPFSVIGNDVRLARLRRCSKL